MLMEGLFLYRLCAVTPLAGIADIGLDVITFLYSIIVTGVKEAAICVAYGRPRGVMVISKNDLFFTAMATDECLNIILDGGIHAESRSRQCKDTD